MFPKHFPILTNLFVALTGLLAPAAMLGAAPSPTATVLTIAPASSVAAGTTVTLTASVASAGKPVSPGLVLFCNAAAAHCTDIHVLGQAQLISNGTATLKLRLPVGSPQRQRHLPAHEFVCHKRVLGPKLDVTGKITTGASILTSGLNFVGTVISNGYPAATGTVSFLDTTNGDSVLASAPLNAGSADVLFTTASMPTVSLTDLAVSLVVGDFNGDGILDFASADLVENTVTILLGNGDGTFTAKSTLSVGVEPSSVAVGDFNSDGIQDLAVANNSDNTVSILLGNGDGTFATKSTPSVGSDQIRW